MSSAQKNNNVPQKKSFAQVAAAANTTPTMTKKETPQINPPVNIIPSPAAANGSGDGAGTIANADGEQQRSNGKALAKEQSQTSVESAESLNGLLQATTIEDSRPSDPALDSFTDTKSVTSRTTLTIDEKESLRPDDSASVQAAQEEDGVSPPESLLAGSKPGTDTDFRAFRNQLYDIERTGQGQGRMLAQRTPLSSGPPPQPQVMGGPPLAPAAMPVSYPPQIVPGVVPPRGDSSQIMVPPDEKLLEALASPKDRLFVLKIEQDMIDFIKDPKESFLQLPQLNTFYRLLSHKLADYYFLGHHYDETTASLRIFRTPSARLPSPLINLDVGTPGTTTPPSGATRRIMKRGNTDPSAIDSGNASLSASKAPSENDGNSGSEGSKNANNSKEKSKLPLSREERENRYKEARARIFANFEDLEVKDPADNVAENDPSRASSTSGAKKGNKKKKPKDDSFEARSAFTQVGGGQPFMPNSFVQMSQPPAGYEQFVPYQNVGHQFHHDSNAPEGRPVYMPSGGMTGSHAWPPQTGSLQYGVGASGQMPYMNHGYTGNNESYGGTSGYSSPSIGVQMTPRSDAANLAGYQPMQGQSDNSGWFQMPMQQQFPMPNAQMGNVMVQPQQGHVMHPYMANMQPGQFAGYQYAPGAAFNQQRFNPQSQAFIPGVPGPHVPPGPPGGPFHGVPGAFGTGSPMQRQNSGPYYPQMSSPASGRKSAPGMDPTMSPTARNNQQSNNPNANSIAKWGTPPHLPPKPPPPAANNSLQQPRPSDMQQPLPANPNNKSAGRSNGVQKQ